MPTSTESSRSSRRLAQSIRARSLELLDRAQPLFESCGVRPPEPDIRFDLRGLAAGQARWGIGERPVLRFNLAMAEAETARFLAQTVPHEVAHLVTAACWRKTRPHGIEWQSVMRFFGAPADRCHTYRVPDATHRRQRRWTYTCGCQSHALSTTRHNRAQAGQVSYHCRRCGDRLRWDNGRAAG
jgi:SprT protein